MNTMKNTCDTLPTIKILLIGGPADGKILNIPENHIVTQCERVSIPDPKNWDYILLYKVRTVDGIILKSIENDAVIFDYLDE